MKDVVVRYTLFKKENGEGLYIIDFNRNAYIAYAENIDIIKNLDEPIADSEELEKLGVYLLKNVKEALNASEEKTKKIIKYLYYDENIKQLYDKDIIKSKSFKVFVLLLETYGMYNQIFLNVFVKNPFIIDFIENDKETKLKILKELFIYLVNIKMLNTKLEMAKLESVLKDLFDIINKYEDIFNKELINPLAVINLFKEIDGKLSDVKYENINQKLTPLSNNIILGGGDPPPPPT